MPQMMPMLWSLMLLFTMSMLLITIIFIHFMNLPSTIFSFTHQNYKIVNWTWLW